MAWADVPAWFVPIGLGQFATAGATPTAVGTTLDAANEALIFIGHIATSDGGSHTIDTTGSSKIDYRTGAVTFSNGSTVVKVGLAAVDASNGPPGRASNAADVISFDVSADLTGGGGGVTANAWQSKTPTTGTKTIANGDLVAFAVQMTARGGADSVVVSSETGMGSFQRPLVTTFTGGSYAVLASVPNVFITFSDGATGWFQGGAVFSAITARTFNSGSATKEYGQLFQFPFPTKIYGLWGFVDPDNDFDAVLYSDPLGTPVAEKTISVDVSTVSIANPRRIFVPFPAPYFAKAYEKVGAVWKPGASNVSGYYVTLGAAGQRVALPGVGTTGYGISRASGAFADANSSLDHYYIGLILGAFQHGGRPQSVIGF